MTFMDKQDNKSRCRAPIIVPAREAGAPVGAGGHPLRFRSEKQIDKWEVEVQVELDNGTKLLGCFLSC